MLHIKTVGICGSDLHWINQAGIGDAQLDHPLILGHEFAAYTDEGTRVAVDPAIPCGQCEFCKKGHPNLCPNVKFAGHGTQDGALQEMLSWPYECLHLLPDMLSDADGAMLEPLGVAIHAIGLGKLQPGMSVGVFGCGPIGLLIVQLAKLTGATQIISTDKLVHRVEAARRYGAHQSLLAEGGDEMDEIMHLTNGRGVDTAFEVAGEQEAVDVSIHAAVPGGRVILVGIPEKDQTFFQASAARRKGLSIKLVRRMKHTYPRALELVANGLVDVSSIITHRFPLERTREAFETALHREGLKVIIEL